MGKNIGIITFHASYNCGSMLQTYALKHKLENMGHTCRIINFSNTGQQLLYSVYGKNNSLKSLIRNFIIFLFHKRIRRNFDSYEYFIQKHFEVDKNRITNIQGLSDEGFDAIITGSDQVWNITIADGDDAYFLPWVKQAKKIAYAPSFGAKSPIVFAKDPSIYKEYLLDFDNISIRENNGKKWIKELTGLDVPVIIDPTLFHDFETYDAIRDKELKLPQKYIFYYSPGYDYSINKLVKKISKKYNLPVIAFNSRNFYVRGMSFSGFSLPDIENPSTYLSLIKEASMVITTSFHGTVFSSIYNKCFWTVKNGGMFGNDDRILTLVDTLRLNDRLIPIEFDNNFNYLKEKDFSDFHSILIKEREKADNFLSTAIDSI